MSAVVSSGPTRPDPTRPVRIKSTALNISPQNKKNQTEVCDIVTFDTERLIFTPHLQAVEYATSPDVFAKSHHVQNVCFMTQILLAKGYLNTRRVLDFAP